MCLKIPETLARTQASGTNLHGTIVNSFCLQKEIMYLIFVFLLVLSTSFCAKEKCETCKEIASKFEEVCVVLICFGSILENCIFVSNGK